MFAVSYYPTLISIKLDLTTHSLGFKWSKSFFIWQYGFPHHLLCSPIYYHWHIRRLGLWCLHSQVIDTNNEKDGGSQQGDPKQFPLSFFSHLAQFFSYTLTLSPCTSSPRKNPSSASFWAQERNVIGKEKRGKQEPWSNSHMGIRPLYIGGTLETFSIHYRISMVPPALQSRHWFCPIW